LAAEILVSIENLRSQPNEGLRKHPAAFPRSLARRAGIGVAETSLLRAPESGERRHPPFGSAPTLPLPSEDEHLSMLQGLSPEQWLKLRP